MHGRVDIVSKPDDFPPPVREDGDGIDLRQLVDFLLRRWKLIATTAAVVMAATLVILFTLTPKYTATAEVLLEPKKQGLFGADSVLPELNLEGGSVDSQVSVLTSFNLLQRVVEKQKLDKDQEFGAPGKPGLLDALKELVGLSTKGAEPEKAVSGSIPVPVRRAVGRLSGALTVSRVARSYVLRISVTSIVPEKAMVLANAIADAYVVDRLDARYEAAKRATNWLTERIEGLKEQVRTSEEAVAKFRQDNNLTVSSEGKIAISEQQLTEINGKLVAARSDAAEKRAKYEQAEQIGLNGGNLQAIPDVVRSSVISDLRKQEAEVARKEADAASRYSDAHPTVVNARAERRDIQRSISSEVGRIIINLKNDFDVAKAREDSLQASLDALTGQGGPDGTVGVKLRELERVAAANRTLFENFLSRAKITEEQTSFEEREARVITPAVEPDGPSFPKKSLFLALAAILGLGLGTAGALALDMLNSGFAAPKEVEAVLGRPVLSSVPLLSDSERRLEGKLVDPVNYLLKKPLSRYSEQVRAVRVGVQMSDVDNIPKVVLVTSSIPKEGKSTLSACLAFSAAKSGQRVLLIDGDLRHPSTTKYFALEGRPGLVDFLTGSAALVAILVPAGPIFVLPAGAATQNPADLLASARMKAMVANLRATYDYILIDSPPVAPVIDARVMSALADKILYVVRWSTTSRDVVTDCLDQLAPDRKLAGIAFNLVDETRTPRYGRYSYYGRNAYGTYYQQ